ncbi:MAG: hypothetical protein ACRENS_03265 [Candidatus Eiseniibacteriota bacterium]
MKVFKTAAAAAALCWCFAAGCRSPGGPPARAWDPDSIPDAFARPTAALVWPGLTRSFLVTPDGALENGLWRVRFELSAGAQGSAAATALAPPAHIASEDRWLPVIRWNRDAGDVRAEFEAVAFPARSASDSVLAVSLRVRLVNRARAPREAELAAGLLSATGAMWFVAADGQTPASRTLRWAGGVLRDSCLGWSDLASRDSLASGSWRLAPGQAREARLVLLSAPLAGYDAARIASVSHAQRVDDVRRYWSDEIQRGVRLELNDPEAEYAFRAAQVVLLACQERGASGWLPIGNPFQYRDLWLRDGARLIQALAVSGHSAQALRLASGISELQWRQGAYLSQRGQLDGTGQALWAFEQAALRSPRGPELAELARHALAACGWYEAQRNLGRQAGWPLARLLPFANPRDGELAVAPLVGNDLWALAGYRSASRVCGAAGMPADSARIEQLRAAYYSDVLAALSRAPSSDVPPCWIGSGRDWGNLVAAWPSQVIPAGDPRCARLARRLWARAGGAGLLCYGTDDSLQTYVGADLGVWAMRDDRPRSADSVLTAVLEWRNGNGAGAELFSRSSRDFGANLPPHPTSAAALVTLIRCALIDDDADTLQLTLAPRDAWWRGARVKGAPTRWGDLDLTFEHAAGRARWSWSPVPVWTRLRVPAGTALAGVPAAPLVALGDHFVLAPPGARAADIALMPDAGTR